MPRFGGSPFALPDLYGATRRILVVNVVLFFALLLLGLASPPAAGLLWHTFALSPAAVVHGALWQLVTYAFLNTGILNTLLLLVSFWFVGALLESAHSGRWLTELFFAGVLAGGLTATVVSILAPQLAMTASGLGAAIFALLVAVAVLHGDLQFMLFFVLAVKARVLVIILLLILLAQSLAGDRGYALMQLGAALAGFLYAKVAPRRGFSWQASESWYGLRNSYYRWKRRRAARKFEVYMKKQGRVVRFDGQGRYLDPEDRKDPNDKRWMN